MVSAVTKIQATLRGRKSRAVQTYGRGPPSKRPSVGLLAKDTISSTASSGIETARNLTIDMAATASSSVTAARHLTSDISATAASSARGAQRFVKRKVLSSVQLALAARLLRLWECKLKPFSITSDYRMPWLIRVAIHEMADSFWINFVEEIVRMFDKMMENSADISPRVARRQASDGDSVQKKLFAAACGVHALACSSPSTTLPSPPPSPPEEAIPPPEPPSYSSKIGRRSVASVNTAASLGAKTVEFVAGSTDKVLHTTFSSSLRLIKRKANHISICDKKLDSATARAERSMIDVSKADHAMASRSWITDLLLTLRHLRFWLRQEFIEMSVTVDLFEAQGLNSADVTGMSDPWCLLALGRHKRRSGTILGTLNPQWNERFTLHERLRDVLMHPLRLEIFDEDMYVRFSCIRPGLVVRRRSIAGVAHLASRSLSGQATSL